MLATLHIKNIGIIDELLINFDKGFNVLTGETGAGKTLIIGALKILSGGRFSKEMIRKGETNSFVELCMYEKEFMMLGFRKINGVDISKFKEKFVNNPIFLYKDKLNKLVEEGLIEIDLNNIKLTNKGIDLANLVFEEFI